MKRPRIALWIKWEYSNNGWCPKWLRLWAIDRVDDWAYSLEKK